jgi:DNA-binding CsgD family transcriptional regulator/predicted hydrocarbon binding protein
MSNQNQPPSLRLFSTILDELLKLGGSVLQSEVVTRALDKIGVQIGEQAYGQYRLSTHQLPPGRSAEEEYVQTSIDFSLWPCTPVSIQPEEVILDVTECPFISSAVENPQYCHLTSGFFGGLAAQHFGKAKVAVVQGKGCPPQHCRIQVLTGSLVDSPSRPGTIFTPPPNNADQIAIASANHQLLQPLTPREMLILGLVGEGLTSRAIAESLHSSVRTIENTIYRISSKLGIRGRSKLIRFALSRSTSKVSSQEGRIKKRSLPNKNG